MKKLLHLLIVFVFNLAFLLQTGCGGGGGGGGNDAPAAGAGNSNLAPPTISGRSVQLAENNRPAQTIQFASTGNSYIHFTTGEAQKSGTYTYAASNNSATLRLFDTASNDANTYTLNFDSATSGSFTYTTSSGASGSGTFHDFNVVTNQGSNPPGGQNPGTSTGGGGTPPGTGNTGGNTGNTGGNTGTGGGTSGGNDTGGLNGRIMVLTRSTGQTHTYTFTETRFVDSDPPEEGSGTYTYSRTGGQASLILNYTGSNGTVNLTGDRHEIRLTFSGERGTYDSTYTRNDGAVLPQTGTFEFVQ